MAAAKTLGRQSASRDRPLEHIRELQKQRARFSRAQLADVGVAHPDRHTPYALISRFAVIVTLIVASLGSKDQLQPP